MFISHLLQKPTAANPLVTNHWTSFQQPPHSRLPQLLPFTSKSKHWLSCSYISTFSFAPETSLSIIYDYFPFSLSISTFAGHQLFNTSRNNLLITINYRHYEIIWKKCNISMVAFADHQLSLSPVSISFYLHSPSFTVKVCILKTERKLQIYIINKHPKCVYYGGNNFCDWGIIKIIF